MDFGDGATGRGIAGWPASCQARNTATSNSQGALPLGRDAPGIKPASAFFVHSRDVPPKSRAMLRAVSCLAMCVSVSLAYSLVRAGLGESLPW